MLKILNGVSPLSWAFRLLLLLGMAAGSSAHAQAQSGQYGDWVYGIDTELTAASTTAADGSRFGMVCGRNCLVYVESSRSCREGTSYSGAAASTTRNFAIRWMCHQLDGRFVLIAAPNEDIMAVVSQCTEVTFSVTLDDATTSVFRFSLGGAYEAVSTMLQAATAIAERSQQPASDTSAGQFMPPIG